MTTLSQFAGGARVPAALIQANSVSGWAGISASLDNNLQVSGAKAILSGALTANTLATVLSITGAGSMRLLGITTVDATSRTLRLQLTLDGVVAFDSTSASIAAANSGDVVVAGSVGASGIGAFGEADLPFKTSCVVKVASSLTETDKVKIRTKYWTY